MKTIIFTALLFIGIQSDAADFSVTNTNDSGVGSFRQANGPRRSIRCRLKLARACCGRPPVCALLLPL